MEAVDIVLILLIVSWIPLLLFVFAIVLNRKIIFEIKKIFARNKPIVTIIMPNSRRVKQVFASFADDTGKILSLGKVRNKAGAIENKTIELEGAPYFDADTKNPVFLWVQGKSGTTDVTSGEQPEKQGSNIIYNRAFEWGRDFALLGKGALPNMDKWILMILFVVIFVVAVNIFTSYQVLEYVTQAGTAAAEAIV